MYALELKTEDGKLTPAQQQAFAELRAAGAIVDVAYGLDQALAQLEAWGLVRGSARAQRAGEPVHGDGGVGT